MVKIKRKVEMTCGEFAKYMVDKFGLSSYESKLTDGDWLGAIDRRYDVSIHLPPSKVSDLPDITITKSGVVIFEVEEEITEDTKLDLVERFVGGMGRVCYTSNRMTIKESLRYGSKECTTTHFYIENDERELVLIWRDGKLVE